MHRSSLLGRVVTSVCLLAGAGLFAPAVRAQDETLEDFSAPSSKQAGPVPAVPPSPSSSSESGAVLPPAAAPSAPAGASAAVSKPAARTGPPPEAGLPGWMSLPLPNESTLEWHGNLELDGGYVKYSLKDSGQPPETVNDSRGRFVLGPMLTHNLGHKFLGHDFFLRVTGQVVAWVREIAGQYYQINADDVYVQVGQQGLWDFMAGRFLTWRVFRKGLGFDLYTIEDTGARTNLNFSDKTAWFQHIYEVNTIFLRETVPAARAALHIYPTSWSGIELVGSYGHLEGSQNVLGGRLATGMKLKYFSLLAGAEYQVLKPDQQQFQLDRSPCDKCGWNRRYGFGGSAALTPLQPIEIAFSIAYGKDNTWGVPPVIDTSNKTFSWGGYLQIDPLSLFVNRSLILGGAFFRTENRNQDDDYQRHGQLAAYLAYPLGFTNAVVKLVFSRATGYQQLHAGATLDADMYSLRLRFAYYY